MEATTQAPSHAGEYKGKIVIELHEECSCVSYVNPNDIEALGGVFGATDVQNAAAKGLELAQGFVGAGAVEDVPSVDDDEATIGKDSTKKELQEALQEKGIEFPSDAKKADLVALLADADDDGA